MSGGGPNAAAVEAVAAGASRCVLCGDAPRTRIGAKNGYTLWRCGGCGLIAARDGGTAFDAAAYYGADYFEGADEKFGYLDYRRDAWVERWNCRRRWRVIERLQKAEGRRQKAEDNTPYTGHRAQDAAADRPAACDRSSATYDLRPATRNVLDVGCATGTFLASAPAGWQRHGLDVSEYAASIARQTTGGEVVCGELGAAPWPERSFDLVTLWDVLDHLADPVEALRRCRTLLQDGGLLVAHVTNIGSRFARWCGHGWHLLIPPTHLHYLTPDSARRVLAVTGFRLVRIERPGKWVPLRLVAFRAAYLAPSPLTRWLKRWLERSWVGGVPIYFNFWDVMTLYARKSADADFRAGNRGQGTGDKTRWPSAISHRSSAPPPSSLLPPPSSCRLHRWLLGFALAVNLGLTVYGIGWGLPARWNVDQEVTEAVKMAAERRWLTYDVYHPPFYKVVVLAALAPYAGYLALRGESFGALAEAASVSWHRLTQVAPDVASSLFLVARGLSAIFGAVMVWLVYRIGLRLMTPIGAVAAAGALAVTMGFVGDNHLERSSPLVGLLGLVVLWAAVRVAESQAGASPDRGAHRWWQLGWLVAGLACAVKYNGLLLALPMLVATCWSGRGVRGAVAGGGWWLLGLLVGWPMLPLSLGQLSASVSLYSRFLYAGEEVGIWPVRLLNALLQTTVLVGVPLALAVAAGVMVVARRIGRREPGWRGWVLAGMVAATYLLIAASFRHRHVDSKFLMLAVPVLALFAGAALERWWAAALPRWLRVVPLVLLLGYSAAYTFEASRLYAGGDTRYQASRWIREQLPAEATIEHLQQPSWLFTEALLDERRILFLGEPTHDAYRSALKSEASASLFDDWRSRIDAHAQELLEGRGQAEYLAVAFPGSDAAVGRDEGSWGRLRAALVAGHAPYRLVAAFEPPNRVVSSSRIRGLSYPRHWWWHPVPNDYVSPAIYLYERS